MTTARTDQNQDQDPEAPPAPSQVQPKKFQLCQEFFHAGGTILGLATGIHAAVHLDEADLKSIPFVSQLLAAMLPLGLYQAAVPFFVAGTLGNFGSNFGAAIDVIVNGVKTFPGNLAPDDNKKWLQSFTAENWGHVFGLAFGAGMTITYLYYNGEDHTKTFTFPFNDQLPNPFFQVFLPILIPGAMANTFYYFATGANTARSHVAKATSSVTIVVSTVASSVASIASPASSHVASAASSVVSSVAAATSSVASYASSWLSFFRRPAPENSATPPAASNADSHIGPSIPMP